MRRMFRYAALVLMLTLTASQVCSVQATLTEEEQEAYRRKKEEKAARETETEAETESESEADEAAEKEPETETESASENASQENTEKASEKEAVYIVAIDPGHQGPGQDMSGTEPVGPGSDVMKARLATGTSGVVSGLDEYELNLEVSLQLRDELEERGYQVVMTREDHDIDISNIGRCEVANDAGADILVRIHANGSEDGSIRGALATAPSPTNPYIGSMAEKCVNLADTILDAYCEETGLANRGLWITDDMTGMNWAKMPVTILEMGFMTNAEDDAYMADADHQKLMVEGIADGIDVYFGRTSE
ncbi:MAG: N-acetylmuramoyl-L-alanine amidase [Eubacteriales bacterium]|nr:N-acetylmuramoyl-L-alanine amidase [Eubacteriales bacterium]